MSEDELTARIASVLPAGQEALTGSEITAEQQDLMADAMGFVNTFLLVFAIVGLVVACFTIFNTFQIIITQRIREMALLRAIGARRTQVLGAQLVEALIVGLLASFAGLLLGFLVAGLLKGLLAALGVDLPAGGAVILPDRDRGPSRRYARHGRAGRVPRIACVARSSARCAARRLPRPSGPGVAAPLPRPRGVGGWRRRPVVGLTAGVILWVGVGALLTFLGVFILGPALARPFAGLVGAPLPAVSGITGSSREERDMRNPKRTAHRRCAHGGCGARRGHQRDCRFGEGLDP